MMKYIIHDWDDAHCRRILQACRAVMTRDTRLIVIDRLLGPPNEDLAVKLSDLHMLVGPGGRERSLDEFIALFRAEGLHLVEVYPTQSARQPSCPRARVTNRTAYRCGAARVAVETGDRDASRWLAEFVTPWFEPCPALSSSRDVRFRASQIEFESIERQYSAATTRPIPCFGLDSDVVQLAGWTEAGTTVVADTELGSFYRVSATGVEVIARPGFPRARIGLMRVVRELLVAGAKAADRLLDLHAAAFATSAGAVLLVGPKQAGKTTLLTHFLRCPAAFAYCQRSRAG